MSAPDPSTAPVLRLEYSQERVADLETQLAEARELAAQRRADLRAIDCLLRYLAEQGGGEYRLPMDWWSRLDPTRELQIWEDPQKRERVFMSAQKEHDRP